MAITVPDNQAPKHPKPVVEGERKFVNGSYEDYATTDEVISLTDPEWRKNKRLWVNGVELFTPDGTNFISPGFQNMSEFFQIVNN